MAGSISLSISQQFDVLGKPLSGGLLYLIQAGTTSTPQNAYKDIGLTIPHTNPIQLDAAGRIPAFYLADGQIKVRLTDKNGVEQFAYDNVQVVGPSDGSGGGGGGGVDPTTVFQTGDVKWVDIQGTITGWVRDNGRTIGSPTSGATERANSDTQALFIWLWNAFDDTLCPVSTGRGASGLVDFQANKTIQLPNKQCIVTGGLSDMGGTASTGFDGVPVVSGSVTTPGSIIGSKDATLLTAHLPPYTPSGSIINGGITVNLNPPVPVVGIGNGVAGGGAVTVPLGTANLTASATQGTSFFNGTAQGGASTPHNNVQQTVLGTFFRKL